MPSCLDQIVSLGVCPDEVASKSGLSLIQAPGISIKNLSEIATETYTNGIDLALEKKQLAITLVKNDFIAALQANNVVANISNIEYDTSIFNPAVDGGTFAGNRGVHLHKNKTYKGKLRSTFIKSVQCYPLVSGDSRLVIIDGANLYSWNVTVVANQVNTFNEEQLAGFPFKIISDSAKVLFDNTAVSFAKTDIKCGKGCSGSLPNPCAWADGWDGNINVKGAGFGVNVNFYCACDFDTILCELSNSFSGELIWLKWQIAIFEEQYLSNRFNDMVIFSHDEINQTVLPGLRNSYNDKWNTLMQGLYNILKGYNDSCLDCRGIRMVTIV